VEKRPDDKYMLTGIRFRAIPTFGCDTIRSAGDNVAALKHMSAAQHEDRLQVLLQATLYIAADEILVRHPSTRWTSPRAS
jgi:hypothetical protein